MPSSRELARAGRRRALRSGLSASNTTSGGMPRFSTTYGGCMVQGHVRVGRFDLPFFMGAQGGSRYTGAATNSTSAEPYAYPAYDRYNASHDEAAVLVDADFL